MKIYGLVLTVAGLLTFAVLPQAGEPDEKEIARLISQLGSDGPETREKAEKALLALKGVPEQLRKACRSPDLEIRSIAKRIVSTIEGQFTTEMFARIERLAKECRFDEAIEHAVRWGDLDPSGKNLVSLAKLARRIRQREAKQFGHLGPKEKSDNPIVYVEESVEFGREKIRLYSSRKTIDVALSRTSMLRGAEVHVRQPLPDVVFIASAGPTTVQSIHLRNSIIYSCDSVKVRDPHDTIIIADGNVEITFGARMESTLIIARGNVTIPDRCNIFDTVILAGGKFVQGKIDKDVLAVRTLLLRENYKDGLGLIKFFDPKNVGIEVESGTKGVKVKHLRKDTPFAMALRVGDVVTAIDGTKCPTPEVFRRALRKALANVGSDMEVSIRRGETTKDVKIPVEP